MESSAVLAQGKSEQTRAQQYQARRGQREKSVGDQIVVAHDTPATLDARPNLLKLYESPAAKEVMRLSAWGQRLRQDLKFRPGNDNRRKHARGKCPR